MEVKKLVDDLLKQQVVGFPTETVYGLAIVYDSPLAYNKLVSLKGRPFDKPLSVMVSCKNQIMSLAKVNAKQKRVISHFFPGPLTVILKAKDNLPEHVTLSTKTVGIRIPNHKTALRVLRKVKKPLLVTSANITSHPPLYKYQDVQECFKNQIASLIKEDASFTQASTVVDLTGEQPVILRKGVITLKEIEKIWG